MDPRAARICIPRDCGKKSTEVRALPIHEFADLFVGGAVQKPETTHVAFEKWPGERQGRAWEFGLEQYDNRITDIL